MGTGQPTACPAPEEPWVSLDIIHGKALQEDRRQGRQVGATFARSSPPHAASSSRCPIQANNCL